MGSSVEEACEWDRLCQLTLSGGGVSYTIVVRTVVACIHRICSEEAHHQIAEQPSDGMDSKGI